MKISKIELLETFLSLYISHQKVLNSMQEENSSYILLDVRNAPSVVKKDKILGSVEIPAKDLESQLDTLDKGKTYVVYDWTAGTTLGKEALLILLSAGFEAYELSCALEGWKGMNLPIEEI